MSRHTDEIYRRWLAQNGSSAPALRSRGGMGGVPPMVDRQRQNHQGVDSRTLPVADKQSDSRPDKQDYVNNFKKVSESYFFEGE